MLELCQERAREKERNFPTIPDPRTHPRHDGRESEQARVTRLTSQGRNPTPNTKYYSLVSRQVCAQTQ